MWFAETVLCLFLGFTDACWSKIFNEILLFTHITTTVGENEQVEAICRKRGKSEPVLLLVRMPHCYRRYGEAMGVQDGKHAV